MSCIAKAMLGAEGALSAVTGVACCWRGTGGEHPRSPAAALTSPHRCSLGVATPSRAASPGGPAPAGTWHR